LFIALWVRSYSLVYGLEYPYGASSNFVLGSEFGVLQIWNSNHDTGRPPTPKLWRTPADQRLKDRGGVPPDYLEFSLGGGFILIGLPHWLAILIIGAVAAVPWLRWQFSLRTLLITTTLVAVVLGIAVYALTK
jgi:hypothetical protein